MTPDELRALADALSRQRQADEHGIYCAVPRQAVDAAIRHLRAQADAQPVAMLASHRRLIEQAIHTAEHPSGMSTHDGKARIDASILRRMLAIIDSSPAAPQAEPIDPHMIVAEDRFPDAQVEPKPTPASGDDLNVYREMADSYRNDAQAEPKREDQPLRDLLAVIHCDGGHHTEAVGIEQSIKDAQAAVCALKVRLALAEPKREPLTDERIDAALQSDPAMVLALMGGGMTVGEFKAALRRLARTVEHAHGISGGGHD